MGKTQNLLTNYVKLNNEIVKNLSKESLEIYNEGLLFNEENNKKYIKNVESLLEVYGDTEETNKLIDIYLLQLELSNKMYEEQEDKTVINTHVYNNMSEIFSNLEDRLIDYYANCDNLVNKLNILYDKMYLTSEEINKYNSQLGKFLKDSVNKNKERAINTIKRNINNHKLLEFSVKYLVPVSKRIDFTEELWLNRDSNLEGTTEVVFNCILTTSSRIPKTIKGKEEI